MFLFQSEIHLETESSKLLPTFLEFKIGGTAYIDFRRGDSYSVKLARFYWTGFRTKKLWYWEVVILDLYVANKKRPHISDLSDNDKWKWRSVSVPTDPVTVFILNSTKYFIVVAVPITTEIKKSSFYHCIVVVI